MIIVERLPTNVLKDLRDAGYSDAELSGMSANELFQAWLEWNGIIGWARQIRLALDGIREVTN